jgi:hypothetical protein
MAHVLTHVALLFCMLRDCDVAIDVAVNDTKRMAILAMQVLLEIILD